MLSQSIKQKSKQDSDSAYQASLCLPDGQFSNEKGAGKHTGPFPWYNY